MRESVLTANLELSDSELAELLGSTGQGAVLLSDAQGNPREVWREGGRAPCGPGLSAGLSEFEQLYHLSETSCDWAPLTDEGGAVVALASREDLLTRCRTPLTAPVLTGNEWEYIKECLDTGWVSSAGKFVTRFEQEIASFVGVNSAVATASGTAALHLALLVAGVSAGDEVVMPTLTFIASGNAVRYLGAYPTFMDVDPDCWQMDVGRLEEFLREGCRRSGEELINRATGRRVKAIMPVHLLGHPCEMTPILRLAEEFGLLVVEDSAEALGGYYRGRHAGSMGLVSALSFNGNKIITAGGGGMVLSHQTDLADRARYLSTQARDSHLEYLHNESGFNYRLTNVASALGVAQLECLPRYLEAKARIASRYHQSLGGVPGLKFQAEAEWAKTNWWLTAVLIDQEKVGVSSREVMNRLRKLGVESRPLFHPLHGLPPFEDCFAVPMEQAGRIYDQGLCLPCSVDLDSDRQDQIIALLHKMF